MSDEERIYEEQKKLALARFKTLKPASKIMLGGNKKVTVKEIIHHIERNDEFGKNAVNAQITMLKVLVGD